jgi:hypothetical protein
VLDPVIRGEDRGTFTREYIGKTHPYDNSTDRWFSNQLRDANGRSSIRDKISQNISEINRARRMLEHRVSEEDYKLKNGAWYFSPKAIDTKFRGIAESNKYGLLDVLNPLNLPYSFQELGSSMSMVESMFGNIAADAIIGAIATKGQNIVRGNAIKALTSARTTEEIAAARQAIDRSGIIAKDIDFIGKATALTSSIWFTNQMRRNETNNEAMDAWISRVMSNMMSSKDINSNLVYNDIMEQLPNYGINPKGHNAEDILELGLAYNIKTRDAAFEQLRESSAKGLSELINKNNALALMDYLEVLPFLNYQGSIFKNIFKESLAKPKFGKFKTVDPSTGEIYKGIELKNGSLLARNPEIYSRIEPSVRAYLDDKIERAAVRLFKNPIRRKKFADVSKFLNSKAGKLFPLMFKEGVEEGQQYYM